MDFSLAKLENRDVLVAEFPNGDLIGATYKNGMYVRDFVAIDSTGTVTIVDGTCITEEWDCDRGMHVSEFDIQPGCIPVDAALVRYQDLVYQYEDVKAYLDVQMPELAEQGRPHASRFMPPPPAPSPYSNEELLDDVAPMGRGGRN